VSEEYSVIQFENDNPGRANELEYLMYQCLMAADRLFSVSTEIGFFFPDPMKHFSQFLNLYRFWLTLNGDAVLELASEFS
jgi:hypothetical protein